MLGPWLLMLVSERPTITLEIDPCLELDVELVHETLELELGAGPELRGAAAAGAADTQVSLDCDPSGGATIQLVDPLTQTSATRVVELSGSQSSERRSEQLAWSAAALVRSTWSSLELDPPARPRDRATRRAARVGHRPSSPWHLGDGFTVRSFLGADAPSLMLGEQVEVVHRPRRHLAWKADGELAYWRVPIPGETELINTLSVSVAPALLVWGEIPSRAPRGAGTVGLYGGAGLRVGGVRMRGGALGSSDGFEAFAGPLAMARASVDLGRFVGLALDAEAGWILHGPERPNDVPLSFVGPWVSGVIVIVSAF